jgi:hypothetical protein
MTPDQSSLLIEAAADRAADGSALMQSSADLCLADARKLHAEGKHAYAARRALKSLEYSVGVFHPAYTAAARVINPAY